MTTENNPHEAPSKMLATVVDYICVKTKDESHDRLGVRMQLSPSWVRAIREGRIAKPDINRVEYVFTTFCNGKVEVNQAD